MIQKRGTSFFIAIFSLAMLAGGMSPLLAFTSTQVQLITMEVTVGGTPPPAPPLDQIQIDHTSLQGISPVSKLAVIEGSAGSNLVGFKPNFKGFLQKAVSKKDAGPPQIRVKTRYRFLGTPQNPQSGTIFEVSEIYQDNPTSFLLQIDKNDIIEGGFQYQVIAEHLDKNGVVLSSATSPASAYSNPDTGWITITIKPGTDEIISEEGGHVEIPDGNPNDGVTSVDVPAGVIKSPTQLSLQQLALNDPQIPSFAGVVAPVAMYKMNASQPFQGSVLVNLLYPAFAPTSDGWSLDGTAVDTSKMSIAVWDGQRWRNIGGQSDFTKNVLTARMGYYNYLGVFPMGAPTAQSMAATRRIITPNGDGNNDYADFTTVNAQVDFYDVNGHRIRTIPPNSSWDGRNEEGKIVESGVYIYQFKDNGEMVSGLIAVAK